MAGPPRVSGADQSTSSAVVGSEGDCVTSGRSGASGGRLVPCSGGFVTNADLGLTSMVSAIVAARPCTV